MLPPQDSCGEFVSALCPYADKGCPDSEGDYDVVLPEPLGGSGGGYRYSILVADAGDEENYDCSGEFYLMASADAPRVGDADGPSMEVVTPTADDRLSPGERVTVKVRHDMVSFSCTITRLMGKVQYASNVMQTTRTLAERKPREIS